MAERAKKKREKGFLVKNTKNKGIRNNPSHFIFFDTETNQSTQDRKIGKPTYKTVTNTLQMGWACYYNSDLDSEEWFYFETIPEFHTYLLSIIKRSKAKPLWIIAHNIVFDNMITDIWKVLKEDDYTTDFIHSKGMVFVQKLVSKKRKKSILLVNNGNIFPTTLKNIGETVDLPKMEVDFDSSSLEYIRTYCKRDVEILVEFWKQWIKFIRDNNLGILKYTISSQSMEAYKHRFCKDYVVLDDNIENLAFERLGYYGGRTEIFFKGAVRKPIYYYDVNSMYPSVMVSERYPTEYKFSKDNPSIENIKEMIEKGWLIMAEVNIDTKLNCYPVKEHNTLLFPIGKFKTYLPTPEVIEGLKNNDILSFGHVSFYKGSVIFKEYIEFFYNERLRLKASGNKQEKMYKLFLNSLYGKFAQLTDNWEKCTIEEIKNFDRHFDFDEWIMDNYKIRRKLMGDLDLTPNVRYIGDQLQMSCDKEESNLSFPAISAHVTSYARLLLWKVINYCKENDNKYYYCDTDSIFVEKEIKADFIHDSELGKMKMEKITGYKYKPEDDSSFPDGVEFINLKNYCPLSPSGEKVVLSVDEEGKEETINLNNDTFVKDLKTVVRKGSQWKMKGVPNNSELIDENTFITQEWGGLPRQEYYKKFGRKPGEYWVIYKRKVNHNKINKGDLELSGNINPFVKEEF